MAPKLPLMLLAAVLAVAGCKTTSYVENFGDWKEISPANSTIAVALPADADLKVYRRKHKFDGTLVENWDWGTGSLEVLKFGQNTYTRDTHHAVSDLTWNLNENEITVDEANATRGVNRLGTYIYGTVESGNTSCFIYSQGYPLAAGGANYHNPTEGAQGYVRGFDCQEGMNAETMTAQFLPMIESMYVQ